jgi:hypothetical protein
MIEYNFFYLIKGLRSTLEAFDLEFSDNEILKNISSRTKLIEYLNIQDLYDKNKVILNKQVNIIFLTEICKRLLKETRSSI